MSDVVVTETLSQTVERQAREIERLRSDVAALEDEIELKSLALSGTSKSMGDEIERLRGLLREWLDVGPEQYQQADYWDVFEKRVKEALGDE